MESAFTIVLNTNPYTYLGNRPFDAAPEATLDRGLVVLAMKKMTVPHILRLAGRALSKGGPPVSRLRFVDYRTDVTEVTVTGHGPFPYQVDGDHLGDTERLVLRHEPEVLQPRGRPTRARRVQPDPPTSGRVDVRRGGGKPDQ